MIHRKPKIRKKTFADFKKDFKSKKALNVNKLLEESEALDLIAHKPKIMIKE